MAANNWDGAANLSGATNLAAADKMRQKTTAAMTAHGSAGGIGYSAAELSTLVSALEAEDPTARRDAIARLLAYYAATQATSVEDRSTPAHVLKKVFEDADLLVRSLYGFFPGGLATDRPTSELLFELESLVAVKRINAGLPALPGTSS